MHLSSNYVIVIRILKIASKLLEMYTIPASNLYFTLRKISKSIMKSRTVPKLKQFFWKMIRNLNPSKWRVISQRCTNILKWRHSDWWLKMSNNIRIKSDLINGKIPTSLTEIVTKSAFFRSILIAQQILINLQS